MTTLADRFNGKFPDFTRDVMRDAATRAVKTRIPAADVGDGTEPFVIASSFADGLMPMGAAAKLIANAAGGPAHSTGTFLKDDGEALGVDGPLGPGVSTGYVIIRASTGLWPVPAGTSLKYGPTNQSFQTLISDSYGDTALVAIAATAGGPAGNLPAGAQLDFVSPPIGVSGRVTVFQNTDGSGLTGGSESETEEEYRARIFDTMANPPHSGNEAEVVRLLTTIPGLPVQRAFTWAAPWGPGTMAAGFTVRAGKLGGTRLPTTIQLTLAQASLADALPGDDGLIVVVGLDDPIALGLGVTWGNGASDWADQAPWPIQYANPVHNVYIGGSTTALHVRVTSSTVITPPFAGQSVAFYNPHTLKFVRKVIKTVSTISATHTYDLTFDGANPATDLSFVPIDGALVSPWSDSLTSVVAPVLEYFQNQGPGEMVATFNDPGKRQRRFPPPAPDSFPSVLENRLVDGLFHVVADAEVLFPNVPLATQIGTLGATFYLHSLSDLGVYPQP